MARIRELKPGFWINEHLGQLPFETRLCFEGLWTHADREGRLEDRPMKLKALIFPYDQLDMDKVIQQLADSPGQFIQRYRVGGTAYIQILNWSKHQKPHPKEAPSEIPPPDECNSREKDITSREISRQNSDEQVTSPVGSGLMGSWDLGNGVPVTTTETVIKESPQPQKTVVVHHPSKQAASKQAKRLEECAEILVELVPEHMHQALSISRSEEWAELLLKQCDGSVSLREFLTQFISELGKAGKPPAYAWGIIRKGAVREFLSSNRKRGSPLEPEQSNRNDEPRYLDEDTVDRLIPFMDQLDKRDKRGRPILEMEEQNERIRSWLMDSGLEPSEDMIELVRIEHTRAKERRRNIA